MLWAAKPSGLELRRNRALLYQELPTRSSGIPSVLHLHSRSLSFSLSARFSQVRMRVNVTVVLFLSPKEDATAFTSPNISSSV